MTLNEIKSMFAVGQQWHALREGNVPTVTKHGTNGHRDEIRTVKKVGSKDIIFITPNNEDYYTAWPKASQVMEAEPGKLKFAYDNGVIVTLTRFASASGGCETDIKT